MAQFKSTTFGKISGKHGDAVAAVRKDGTCILKVYRVASNPNTAGQKNQRGKFGFVMKELNCMRKLFTATLGGQYGINKAVAIAMKNAVQGEFPDFELDYNHVQISEKLIPSQIHFVITSVEHLSIKISWMPELWPDDMLTSTVSVVVLNPLTKNTLINEEVAAVTDGSVQINLPKLFTDTQLHYWLYLTPANYAAGIQSKYLGLL